MAQRELFINSVRQIRVGESAIIPTVVYYDGTKPFVGIEALERCDDDAKLREDFKVELGKAEPIKLAKSSEGSRSVLGICKDFVDSIFQSALSNIQMTGCERPTRVLVAEPISISQDQVANESWLNNYRAALKRVLTSNIAEVDFLPEPFAVFQYYRYGTRHALVAQKIKHVALVFDFGGGTFDASVIETTADGDISKAGRNSKPLAAKSLPIGGFYINRMLAEYLLFKTLDKTSDKASIRKALDKFSELKNADDEELNGYPVGLANCIRNYRRLLRSVEQAKISICNGIPSWKLDADLSKAPAYSIPVPQRPQSDGTPWVSVRLGASEIRAIYEDRIWKQRLLPAIKETLKRADAELSGKPISIILLSGGSSNIRWIKPLIERDLSVQLGSAEILELSENFQEIVSKGLAIECARRFYTEGDGDFRAITYNRLCLTLSPNSNEPEVKRFAPDSPEIKQLELEPGVLLPSSTSLKGFAEKPLRWRVRLTKAPTQRLDYYFLRSSFDHTEASALQNIDHTVFTPKDASFGASILVELLVKEDGTTEPTFIYGHGERGRNTVVKGRPFALDMTYAANEGGVGTYLGFDFWH
jgi:molecular chaperone DnaK (HSP70)